MTNPDDTAAGPWTTDPLPQRVWQALARLIGPQAGPGPEAPKVVLAVSGGLDSVTLLELLAGSPTISATSVVAHFHHGWRAEEADADAQLVQTLAEQHGLAFELGRAPPTPLHQRREERARTLRYAFLTEVAQRHNARFVVTAHTADDQVETVLHHLVRGTGLGGLRGMAASRALSPDVMLIRPLLETTRAELLRYATVRSLTWREDASNHDRRYARSRIRYEVLPALRSAGFPQVDASLLRLSQQSVEATAALEAGARAWLDATLIARTPMLWQLDVSRVPAPPTAIILMAFRELFAQQHWPRRELTARVLRRLAECIEQPARRRFHLPGPIQVSQRGGLLTLQHMATDRTAT